MTALERLKAYSAAQVGTGPIRLSWDAFDRLRPKGKTGFKDLAKKGIAPSGVSGQPRNHADIPGMPLDKAAEYVGEKAMKAHTPSAHRDAWSAHKKAAAAAVPGSAEQTHHLEQAQFHKTQADVLEDMGTPVPGRIHKPRHGPASPW